MLLPVVASLLYVQPLEVTVSREYFSESNEAIDNPDRGLYSIYGFYITDQREDYGARIKLINQSDSPTNLLMIQINLKQYRSSKISPEGLRNLDRLFSELQKTDKNLIVRFTYDWNGTAELFEPDRIEIVLEHMEQLENLLRTYEDKIFVVQGLFIGKWGEMNGTRYSAPEDLKMLSEKLMDVTGDATFLSVRTGSQWRMITDWVGSDMMVDGDCPRIGLYNDGMMGNESDLGSYGSNNAGKADPYANWSREKELDFQNVLCRYVPNGGEVVINNPLNDFDNAVAMLKKMHISYLNYDYDLEVLEKWAAVTIEEGVYAGIDGFTYIERHLGYRILIDCVKTAYHAPRENVILDVDLKNVGFAPVYAEKDIMLQIYNEQNELVYSHTFDQDIRQLYGGENSGEPLELHHEIHVAQWPAGEFEVYLTISDRNNGEQLVLANEQTISQYGYKIAGIRRS